MEQDHSVRDRELGVGSVTAHHLQDHIFMVNRSSMVLGAEVVHAVADGDSRLAVDGVAGGMGELMDLLRRFILLIHLR